MSVKNDNAELTKSLEFLRSAVGGYCQQAGIPVDPNRPFKASFFANLAAEQGRFQAIIAEKAAEFQHQPTAKQQLRFS